MVKVLLRYGAAADAVRDDKLTPLLIAAYNRYRGTSLIRNAPLIGPYSRTISRVLWWSWGGGRFLMSVVPL